MPNRLGQDPVRQAEVGADPGRLGLGRVPAESGELIFEGSVPAQGALVGVGRELRLERLHLAQDGVEAARGQDAVRGGDVQIAGTGVLRQVADRPAALDGAGERLRLAGQHLQGGGLAGAVASDETDAVARLHAQRRLGQQDPSAGAKLQGGGRNHGGGLLTLGKARLRRTRVSTGRSSVTSVGAGRSVFAEEHAESIPGLSRAFWVVPPWLRSLSHWSGVWPGCRHRFSTGHSA